jgi:hypothetical protein
MDLRHGLVISPQRHPSTVRMGKYFAFGHLPADLQEVSEHFARTAQSMVNLLQDCPELTKTLQRLWEAKNMAILAAGFLDLTASREQKLARGDAVTGEQLKFHG